MTPRAGMLAGITVLDFSLQLPGPYATMLLRASGARVTRIEPPGGDPARVYDPRMVETLEAGKERLTLDLRVPAAREIAQRLAAQSDVAVEGFRPGVVERLGIDFTSLRAHRPDLVYCSISGFGQAGPYRSVPGHDINYLAVGGGVDPLGDGHHAEVGLPIVDLATGSMAAFVIAAALLERASTGEGRYLDVAMIDSAVFWTQLKVEHGRADGGHEGGQEPAYGVARTADGSYLALGVVEDKFWQRLCAVLVWDDWVDDPVLARHEGRHRRGAEVAERLRSTIATRSRAEWLDLLWQADIPATPLNGPAEVAVDPQVAERALFVADEDGRPRLRAPVPSDATGGTEPRARRELLAEIGYDDAAVRELAAAGAFGS